MKIIPLGNRVLVEPVSLEKQTSSGIIIPDTIDKEKPEQGKVVAIGEGDEINVKEGDVVVFSKYGYDEVKIEETEYYILEAEKVLAKIK
ncbi:MAG: co-chaperone GroES [Candidatus Pacebacteria bacterium]|nr:co-chaperone GroES [Candidatus Paceibacterota bacterium]